MAFDTALGAAHALPGDPPKQPLAFIAVGGGGGRPHLKVVWCGGRDGVDQSLQGLFINVTFLKNKTKTRWDVLVWHQRRLKARKHWTEVRKPTSSSLPRVVDAMAEVIPALREFWTRDWKQEGERKVFMFECELNNGLHIYVSLRAKIVLTIAWWDRAEIKQERRETKMWGYFRNFKQQAVFTECEYVSFNDSYALTSIREQCTVLINDCS